MKNRCFYCYEPISGEDQFHASCSKEFFGSTIPPELPYGIDEIKKLAKIVVEQSIAIPGVQPKISMAMVKEMAKNRLTVVGALGGYYILKPPSDRFLEMPENEHLTMRLAEAYGIRVVPSTLFQMASGQRAYLTRRIDRKPDGTKIHMLDMFQITEAHNKYKSSMEKVGNALHQYSANTLLDKLFLFELTVFCFLTGNSDMHLKNFSMLRGKEGWTLAPAYDLLNVALVFPEDTEDLALTMDGKKKKFRRQNFINFGIRLGLTEKQISAAIERMLNKKSTAVKWVENCFLSDDLKRAYLEVMEERYRRLAN
jgi:serine/threonine-protein kinase HipA